MAAARGQGPCSTLQLLLLLALVSRASGLDVPLEVEQPPTITRHSTGPIIVLPFDFSVTVSCEAKGNPAPEYRWTKDGEDFTPPVLGTSPAAAGSFTLPNKQLLQFQGRYRCYASNRLGTAMTEEIQLLVSSAPKFPKEEYPPTVVREGEPIVLHCDPPEGIAPRQLFWMTIDLQHIELDERVSMGIDGNLYFAHAVKNDSRPDYCCIANFQRIRTIRQKPPMALEVKSWTDEDSADSEDVIPPLRKPSLLLPSGVQTEKVLLKGQSLELECIPGGYPTPTVTWKKMGEKQLPDWVETSNFGKQLIVAAVEERDAGKYMCTATNSAGGAVHYFDIIVEEPPRWLQAPVQGHVAVIGSDVLIRCSVSGSPAPDITWRKNGELLRGDLQTTQQVLDDVLVLGDARPEDSGVYQCEASNTHGSITSNILVMVLNVAPRILTLDLVEYAVVEGGDVVLSCSVFSSPPAALSWSKHGRSEELGDGRVVSLQDGSLQVLRAQKNDSGAYVCEASNTEGRSAITAVLDVKDPTEIVAPPEDVQVVRGTTAQLRCKAQYDPSLQDTFQLLWRKDGQEILSSLENSRHSVEDDLLQILNLELSDEGLYTCVARTSLDEDKATALLTVLDVPDAPANVEISELENPRNIQLSWQPGSDHNSSITEFVVEFEESQWEPGRWRELQKVPGNQAAVELQLHGHLSYQFRVYAVNAVGPGPPSPPTHAHQTPPAAPDRNPEDIKIHGHLPHQMDISWRPLQPLEHNGPGLEYKVSYRRLGLDDVWTEHLEKRHSFVVKNTSTFVPYEVKIQSRNSHGWGPEPRTLTGYSGEDVPSAAPQDVAVELLNSTVLRVSWSPVPASTVRGHLGGYQVRWLRRRSLLTPNRTLDERRSLSFLGGRSHGIVPGLEPFSEYQLTVNVFNKKGNGPSSDAVTFSTPEGVPEQVSILTDTDAQADSILLTWAPPLQAHGILTRYLLSHQLLNETTLEVLHSQQLNVSTADTTQWRLRDLEEGRLYRVLLRACTSAGCGPEQVLETRTIAETLPVLLNISSNVNDTSARISWTAREEQQDTQLYVAYMNNRDGNWRISEAVNTSQSFYVISGLVPRTEYTVRLLNKRLLHNASMFEEVFQTAGVAGVRGVSGQGWLIGTMCAGALLTLLVLVVCFIHRSRGGKYAVKEKEDPQPDVEAPGMTDDTYEYSDSEEKPLRSSSCSEDAAERLSRDSLVDCSDSDGEFNEDGSFIGEYSGHRHGGSNGPSSVTA